MHIPEIEQLLAQWADEERAALDAATGTEACLAFSRLYELVQGEGGPLPEEQVHFHECDRCRSLRRRFEVLAASMPIMSADANRIEVACASSRAFKTANQIVIIDAETGREVARADLTGDVVAEPIPAAAEEDAATRANVHFSNELPEEIVEQVNRDEDYRVMFE